MGARKGAGVKGGAAGEADPSPDSDRSPPSRALPDAPPAGAGAEISRSAGRPGPGLFKDSPITTSTTMAPAVAPSQAERVMRTVSGGEA